MENFSRVGFDNEKYLQEQTSAILERVSRFNDKLYLEFGGKILYDYLPEPACSCRERRQWKADHSQILSRRNGLSGNHLRHIRGRLFA